MKHIFIVNPASGKENSTEEIKRQLAKLDSDVDWELYVTKSPGDATQYIKKYCEEHRDPVRFYACGGDGTLHEAANGIVGHDFAALGCVPCGSGNDFVKYYGDKAPFLDMKKQVSGRAVSIDLIKVGERYAINAVHFGFDSCVADLIPKYRRNRFIGGKLAYPMAVGKSLLTGMRHQCCVEVEGELLNEAKEMLLCTIANGQYVGGSYRCAPKSKNDDGELEVCVMQPISVIKFLMIAGVYQAGKHFEDPRFTFMRYKRGKNIHVTAPEGFIYSMDGEIIEGNDFVAEVVPGAIQFIVPEGIN